MNKGKIYIEHNSPRDEITYEGVGVTSATGLVINHINSCLVTTRYVLNDDGSFYVISKEGEILNSNDFEKNKS